MKKLICLILVLILAVGIMAACGNDAPANTENDIASTDSTETEKNPVSEVPPTEKETNAPSKSTSIPKENSELPIVREPNQSLDFYLILNGTTNEETITYHTKDCPLLKNKETQKITWEMVTTLEFRHCSKCNPPKYDGYVE